MLLESLLALSIIGNTAHNGGLEIHVEEETKERVNKDLDQYNTPLFNQESKALNDEIKKRKTNINNILNNLCLISISDRLLTLLIQNEHYSKNKKRPQLQKPHTFNKIKRKTSCPTF